MCMCICLRVFAFVYKLVLLLLLPLLLLNVNLYKFDPTIEGHSLPSFAARCLVSCVRDKALILRESSHLHHSLFLLHLLLILILKLIFSII